MNSTDSTAIALPFVEDLELVVPDDIQLMTTYVLQEQGDWFEIEASFVRKLLQPGMQVIDVGANFGVYAIPMASSVGQAGNVWAFEPCRITFDHLVQSVKRNKLTNITLIRSGLGERQGIVRLATSNNAELNAITTDANAPGEIIDLTTLDTCVREMNIVSLDFMKLDAEGYESKVLEGGSAMLREFEPLVMFELRHNETVNLSLIEEFSKLGMDTFSLIPGAEVLVPFDPDVEFDSFRLNLFACTPARAEVLRSRGLLATEGDMAAGQDLSLDNARARLGMIASTLDLPLVEAQKVQPQQETSLVKDMLRCLAVEAGSGTPGQRVSTLRSIVAKYKNNNAEEISVASLALLARCARNLGEQHLCVDSTVQALELLRTERIRPQLMIGPLTRFDDIAPDGRFHEWVVSHLLECFERSRAFSSFMLGEASITNLEILRDMGFAPDDMNRRLSLIKQRFGHPESENSESEDAGLTVSTDAPHSSSGREARSLI